MRIQEIQTSDYLKRYVVVDGNGNLVVPVVRYLKYLNAIGRARNTLRSYAQSLSLYFTYLAQEHLEYQQVTLDDLGGFVRLRSRIPTVRSTCCLFDPWPRRVPIRPLTGVSRPLLDSTTTCGVRTS